MADNSDGRFVFASTNKGPNVFVVADKKWYPLATDADVQIREGDIKIYKN